MAFFSCLTFQLTTPFLQCPPVPHITSATQSSRLRIKLNECYFIRGSPRAEIGSYLVQIILVNPAQEQVRKSGVVCGTQRASVNPL
ncbi:hypothetical protein C8R46DRAFT_1149755 [Mycena filopes]|nr:hypothetical protein C8R46DRAFT_1149755 [Mycena filopes]